MQAALSKATWYADGLRWIGAAFNSAADRIEERATAFASIDPRVHREMDQYMHEVRTRVHTHF